MEVLRFIESWVLGFYNSKLVPLKLEYYLLCIDKLSIFESGTFSRVPIPPCCLLLMESLPLFSQYCQPCWQ